MKIGIVGAGLVGCFIGAHLQKNNHTVVYVGSERVQNLINKRGHLKVTNLKGEDIILNDVNFSNDPLAVTSGFDYVIITLKIVSMTQESLSFLSKMDAKTVIVTFQNGVSSKEVVKSVLNNDNKIVTGMFPFNVVELEDFHICQASQGSIMVEDTPEGRELAHEMQLAGLNVATHPNILGILYGKLLFNLNNSLNALSGLSIKEQLSDHEYRKILSYAQEEAIATYNAEGVDAVSISFLPINWIPFSLRLPNWLFTRVAAASLEIDEKAFGSMYQDLHHRRKTEVEYLNGKIVELGKKHNIPTPINEGLVKLIQKAEQEKNGSPKMTSEQIRLELNITN